MKNRRLFHTLGPALLVAGMCIGTAAMADALPTISIQASVVNKKVIEMSGSGIPTEEVTVTRQVSYADLDLRTHAGTQALKERVKKAAELACKQIDELYPLEQGEAPTCIKQSVEMADSQVHEAIAAAHGEAAQ
ncbi:MAG: UrcA family protein [Steroidobacteraceae bacterium]